MENPSPRRPNPTVDDLVSSEGFRAFDRLVKALTGRMTAGISPAAVALAVSDWAIHLAAAPGKQTELAFKGVWKAGQLAVDIARSATDAAAPPGIEPLPGDRRFAAESWRQLPFRLFYQSFLLGQQWWHNATREVPGVTPHHEEVVSFLTRQLLDMASPSNLWWLNPEVLERTIASSGMNLLAGVRNLSEDVHRLLARESPAGADRFSVGKEVAVTPGKIIYRNRLVELIQYGADTADVFAEPVLIVPAWIMKYYILDLSPERSLIRYLVANGHTVFCISWRNVTAEDRDLGFDDYRRLGIGAALAAIGAVLPDRRVHGVGYCLGGTLLAVEAAAMARAGDARLRSMTLLAAQTDFSEPGELALFIDESQVDFMNSIMWNRGYLDAALMAGAFQLLRSNDLIWSRILHDYLMGERAPMTDLNAWNADTTRLPYRMHSEYLQSFFLHNDFACGRYLVDGEPVAPQNITIPIFAVGTEWDHVAPWRSVYKIHSLTESDITFALVSGGHNAGIVAPPGPDGRHFCIRRRASQAPRLGAEAWLAGAERREGSWWPAWAAWLREQSSAERVAPPPVGAAEAGYGPAADAPGSYVLDS